MKKVIISQSEKDLGRNRPHRRLEAELDNQEREILTKSINFTHNSPDNYSQARSNSVQGSSRRNYAKEGVSQTTSPSALDTYRQNERATLSTNASQPTSNKRGMGNSADSFNITFCPHLDYCPVVSSKNCLFNFGYESCQVAKFYNKWGK